MKRNEFVMMSDAPLAGSTGPKPKIAVLGEFSSGKSTLANVLLGRVSSPVRVTATQVPPIWYTHGDGNPIVVDSDGQETEISIDEVASVPVEGTQFVRVFIEAPILQRLDFIDMPGSSDPNMSPDIWNAILPQADAVIWCTPATQAWRQSEAAIWEEVDPDVQERSVLLVTRIDKVLSDTDRARLMKRIRRETTGTFRDVFAVDLMSATSDLEGDAASVGAGTQAVQAAIEALLGAFGQGAATDGPAADPGAEAAKVLRLQDHAPAQGAARPATTVMPRRISSGGLTAMRRPRRTTGTGGSAV
jgi:GTPase SAR1 family protein